MIFEDFNSYSTHFEINLILFLFSLVILAFVLTDKYKHFQISYRFFTWWVLSYTVYIACQCFYWIMLIKQCNEVHLIVLQAVESIALLVYYSTFGKWIIDTVAHKREVPKWLQSYIWPIIILLFIAVAIVSIIIGAFTPAFILLLCYLLFIAVVIVVYFKELNTSNAVLLLLFTLLEFCLRFQTSWLYTPDNILGTLFILCIYHQMWQKRKHEMLDREKRLAEIESELTKASVNTMLSQIGPHFLYNTLNSVSVLCTRDGKLAQKVTENLAEYLRGNLDSINSSDLIPFSQELQHTKFYTDIEQVRFGDTVKIVYDIKEQDFDIPPLTVQPLVENAIKHGLRHKRNGGTVTVSTTSDCNNYIITVKDDGIGFNTDNVRVDNKKHYGVSLVQKRINLLCHGELRIESATNVGTTATVSIPKDKEK